MKKLIGFLWVCFYVNVHAQCTAPTVPAIIASSTTVCINKTATLSIASGSLNSATNWHWYSGSCGGSPVGTGTSVVVFPGQDYYVRGEGGCVTPGSCASVTIYALGLPNIIGTNTSQAICGNSNGTATVIVNGSAPPFSFNWNTIPVQTNSIINSLPPGTWSTSITDANGCSITTSVGITAAVVPTLNVAGTNIKCFGQSNGSATLTPIGVGGYTYQWSNSVSFSAIANGLGPAIYSATLTDANGCHSYTSITITEPNPLVLNVSPSQTICNGNSTNVWAQAMGGTTPYSYTLTNLATNSPTMLTTIGGISAFPTLTSTVQYTVAIKDANGCVNGPQLINANVWPGLIASGYSVMVCDGDSVNLAANFISIGNGGPYNYNWSNMTNNAVLTVAASLANSPATYTVLISDGCTISNTSATFTVNAAICTNLKSNKNIITEISFYPNPVNDVLTIEPIKTIIEVKLFSVEGKEILNKTVINLKTEINLSDLSNGMYYLRFYDKTNAVRTEKIIVQH